MHAHREYDIQILEHLKTFISTNEIIWRELRCEKYLIYICVGLILRVGVDL